MTITQALRERQAPIKQRYQDDPDSAKLTLTVSSSTKGDDPTKVSVITDAVPGGVEWNVGAHPFAGGEGDLACSGDLLLASLAACQEITLRMVATTMGIALESVELEVSGDLDFRGTMGTDADTPVGFTTIRTNIHVTADAPADRLERLIQRAEKYCVVGQTLRQSPLMDTSITAN